MSNGHLVVVGASLAGLSGAEAARRAGLAGRLTVVGAEPHRPYDRPPLSKHVLTGEFAADATTLPACADLDCGWRLGAAARRLDREAKRIDLADGSHLDYDRLLIATGARARPWPNQRERALAGLHTLRDREDAQRLRSVFLERPARVVIVGGGFIGCEVAHAARACDLPVTLVDRGSAPMARVLGTQLGSVAAARLEAAGVELRLGAEVRRLEDDGRGHLIRLLLMSGEALDTGCVVAALGAIRNTEWLEGCGLSFDEQGVDCDDATRALDANGTPDPDICVAGDVARFPHPIYGRVALEHWQNAKDQGAYAGAVLAGSPPDQPYQAMPSFWSTQGDFNIKSIGLTKGADAMAFAQGHPKSGRFLVIYGREGRCIAAVSFDMARWLPAYADLIARRAPFPPIREATDQGPLAILDPGFRSP